MTKQPIYTADCIARVKDRFVVIERLTEPKGFAFPGGKQDPNEILSETIVREYPEETGLSVAIQGVIGAFADHDRDPRGWYVTTLFYGSATGTVRAEQGKTRVHLFTESEIANRLPRFVLGHDKLWAAYKAHYS
jgi:ADP-ribose pyrophosphatase YjhB (NUDIX family)